MFQTSVFSNTQISLTSKMFYSLDPRVHYFLLMNMIFWNDLVVLIMNTFGARTFFQNLTRFRTDNHVTWLILLIPEFLLLCFVTLWHLCQIWHICGSDTQVTPALLSFSLCNMYIFPSYTQCTRWHMIGRLSLILRVAVLKVEISIKKRWYKI